MAAGARGGVAGDAPRIASSCFVMSNVVVVIFCYQYQRYGEWSWQMQARAAQSDEEGVTHE